MNPRTLARPSNDSQVRGPAPTEKINYKDHYEYVYLRHSAFRRAVNPDETTLKKLLPLIKPTANKTYYKYRNVLSPMGFHKEDLINIGLVHAVSFLAQYDVFGNKGLFVNYLKQRYHELIKITQKKANIPITDLPAEVNGELYGFEGFLETYIPEEPTPITNSVKIILNSQPATLELREIGLLRYQFFINGQPITNDYAKKILAGINDGSIPESSTISAEPRTAIDLDVALATLPPTQQQIVLNEIAESNFVAIESKNLAKKLLTAIICPNCNHKIISGLKCLECNVLGIPKYGIDTPKTSHSYTKEQITQLTKTIAQQTLERLPATSKCCKCQQFHPKEHFGVRVAKDKLTGLPVRGSRQSYCRDCRKKLKT